MKNYTLLILCLLLIKNSYSQTIKGQITNGNDVIPFANISVKSTGIGVAADGNGRFILNDVPKENMR